MAVTNTTKTFNLRLPPELRAWLEREARNNVRSLNSEIVFRLADAKASCEVKKTRKPGRRPT
jgi:predicted HicB family RNase H-like nuclease